MRCHLCSSCDRRLSRTLRGPPAIGCPLPARSRTAAGAGWAGGLLSAGRLLKMNRAGPAGRRTESQDYSQPGIFDVVADLFSVPGPIAVARLSTGQSGRRGAPPWRPPRRGTEAPRPRSRVAVLAPLIHISTHFHSNGSATADSARCRPPFRNDLAHRSDLIPPGIPR